MSGQYPTKTLKELIPGDIVKVHVLFAENTRDYYNGYTPEEIRGGRYTDRFGRAGKDRMVIFLGRDGKSMNFLPLTSKHGSFHDLDHQYELKDNSMTEKSSPNLRSFVEVDHVRMLKVSYQTGIHYIGHAAKEDMDNLYHRISNNTLQYNGMRDQRGYVPKDMVPLFEKELKASGYEKTSTNPYRTVYQKQSAGQTVVRTENGMVHYHKELSKDAVRQSVTHREQYRDRRTLIRQAQRKNHHTHQKPGKNKQPELSLTEGIRELEHTANKEASTYAASY